MRNVRHLFNFDAICKPIWAAQSKGFLREQRVILLFSRSRQSARRVLTVGKLTSKPAWNCAHKHPFPLKIY